MASSTQWAWVFENSGRWWKTGKPGVFQSMGLQSRTLLSYWTSKSTESEGGRSKHQNWSLLWSLCFLHTASSYLEWFNSTSSFLMADCQIYGRRAELLILTMIEEVGEYFTMAEPFEFTLKWWICFINRQDSSNKRDSLWKVHSKDGHRIVQKCVLSSGWVLQSL